MDKGTVARCQIHDSRGYTSMPRLCSLPATSEAIGGKRETCASSNFNMARHKRRRSTTNGHCGWRKDEANRSLVPTTIADTVHLAPDAVLRLIRCGCESDKPCRSSRCGCRSAKPSLTMFCACHDGICCNTNAL